MLINIHLLQNYAPSNLNRDDTGAPKDTVFGGVLRARTSSQSLKRSIRRADGFKAEFKSAGLLAQRTRLFPVLLRERLIRDGLDPAAAQEIAVRAVEFGRESSKGRGEKTEEEEDDKEVGGNPANALQTKQLIFLTDAELGEIASKLVTLYQRVGATKFAKMKREDITREIGAEARLPRSVDIAMFGRMTTSAAFIDVEAAVQVAHAISTHRVEQEFDYYTAVDDISGESGAGFIGDTPFNSATYYKYFNVHWEGLLKNLAGDSAVAAQGVLALIRTACTAHPSGKQNSFAAHNLPDLILVEVRAQNIPVSYANAFQRPVRATPQQSLMEASAEALTEYVGRLDAMYNLPAQRAVASTLDVALPQVQTMRSLDELLGWLAGRLPAATGVAAEAPA